MKLTEKTTLMDSEKESKSEGNTKRQRKMNFTKKHLTLIVSVGGLLVLICFVLLLIPEIQIPTVLQSSGLVAIISAFLGVIMTVGVTAILLERQSETQKELIQKQSNTEAERDKNVKIYEQKLKVCYEFTSQLWEMLYDVDNKPKVLNEKFKELELMCFNKLVFFLKPEETNELVDIIKNIAININALRPADYSIEYICNFTNVLQKSLINNLESESHLQYKESHLNKLYEAFRTTDKNNNSEKESDRILDNDHENEKITFWHFNMLGDEQIEAFREGKWFLSLIEYDEDWRTRLLKQVNIDDVVFLFRRGGYGYIGAFRVKDCKVLENIENPKENEIKEYDIYGGIVDGASFVSCLKVEPIALNYLGVGYYTVRRRTIERMNDREAVKFLLNRFNGNFNDIHEDRIIRNQQFETGNGKIDENYPIKEINKGYFDKIKKYFA